MKKLNELCKISKKALVSAICIAAIIITIGSMTACAAKENSIVPQQESEILSEKQETTISDEMQQESALPGEQQQESVASSEKQQETVAPSEMQQEEILQNTVQQDTRQPEQNSNEQISLEDAKNAALKDAGLVDSDVNYTKDRLDYEDGIAVYEIEFYADNVEYEYEINAATGAVYSKSVETHQNQAGRGNGVSDRDSGTYIDVDSAKSIALDHAGFAAADVSRLKSEFDMDDGQAVYEVEFDKDGREYEYTINAIDGSIIEYDVD